MGVPISFLSRATNLANMLASRRQHAALAICPRSRHRDDKINERLIPKFDRSDDPEAEEQDLDLHSGVKTINLARRERGSPPAEWARSRKVTSSKKSSPRLFVCAEMSGEPIGGIRLH